MSANSHDGSTVVVGVLLVCTVIGIFGADLVGNAGTAVTWIWTGIGLSVTYLLYRVLGTLQRIADAT